MQAPLVDRAVGDAGAARRCRTWLLDRCEDRGLWFALREGFEQPRPLTVSQLADQFRTDADMQSVARLYAADHLGKRDWSLAQVLESVIADEHVPYLAALRYRPTGLAKREEWEHVWEQQREEDRTGERLDHRRPAEVQAGRLRQAVVLVAARQARRAQGAVHLLPGRRAPTPTRRCCSAGPGGITRIRRRCWSTWSTTAAPTPGGAWTG